MTTATSHSARPWRLPMRARDQQEPHRASTPLELLFDLTFVVAVAGAAAELHHALADGRLRDGLVGYLSLFFAIWWAWMNFTWFASAYDVDDVPYRLATLLQMAGVLVLAAGVPSAFETADFTVVTVGYVLMRVALVGQWLRAGAGDPRRRRVAVGYAVGITVVQVGWLLRLALPEQLVLPSFLVLVAAELTVPLLAERLGPMTSWHPRHISERYSLFTLIVLGESILASSTAFQGSFGERGADVALVLVAVGGLVIVFSLWWLYFEGAEHTEVTERSSFVWGYGHYAVFAAIAAVGAALQLCVEALHHEVEPGTRGVLLSLAVPVCVFLVVTRLLTSVDGGYGRALLVGAAQSGGLLAVTLAASSLPLEDALPVLALALAALVTATALAAHRRSAAGAAEVTPA